MTRKLHLNVNILNSGFLGSAWRHPSSDPRAIYDVNHYVRTAQIAERGLLDAIFLADTPVLKDNPARRPYQALEPTIILAAIAAQTNHIGLIATVSTTYNDPYNIARRFGTLDHVSDGRIGVNLVTTADRDTAANFSQEVHPEHGARYTRAGEFATVLKKLWNSWEEEAFVGDKASARFVNTAAVHAINHQGQHFSVKGPLTFPRGPQGHPVIVQAGGSDEGRRLAAQHAEVVFSVAQTIEDGVAFVQDIRARAATFGRDPSELVFLPGLATVIGGTEAEAKARHEELLELLPLDYSLGRLAEGLGLPVEALEVDGYLPEDLVRPAGASHSMFDSITKLAQRDKLTVRQLARRLAGGTGHRLLVGTPEQVADSIEEWFRAGAADGFNLMADVIPSGVEAIVDHVVPELQRRGLFRTEYAGDTLRDRLGLSRPQWHHPEEPSYD